MKLCVRYRRKRVRKLSVLINDERRAASRALLRHDPAGMAYHKKQVTAYTAERSILLKPPYWHRRNTSAYLMSLGESAWAGWHASSKMKARGTVSGRISYHEIFKQEHQNRPWTT